jgi:transposase InsO family protein
VRDEVIDYVRYWSDRTDLGLLRLVDWMGLGRSKYYDWRRRYGAVNEHNGWVPRDHWLEKWEREAIMEYYREHPLDGYRRLTYMMLDADVVAASPSSVYRVLSGSGLLRRWNRVDSKKGRGFEQPERPHEHWHTDVSQINVCGTFYFLCAVLDGYSRYVVHWEIRERMCEPDVETIVQRALEAFPGEHPRLISDNGPQFVAKDFKSFIRLCGMTHVRTSPYHPQSNGKIERWLKSVKSECIRRQTPLSLEDARRVVSGFVDYYNTERLHSAIGYIAPKDKLDGRAEAIWAARERKLAEARERRRAVRKHKHNRQQRERKGLTFTKEARTMTLAGETDAGSAGEHPARDSRLGGDGHPSGGVIRLPQSHDRATAQRDIQSFPYASENSDLPKASHPSKPEDHCSSSG